MRKRAIALLLGVSFLLLGVRLPSKALAATGTITGSSAYAWGDTIGWINFKADGGNVTVSDSALTGYAWAPNYGWINLSPTNGGVINTCAGVLGGKAWSGTLGWINFAGATINSSGQFIGTIGTEGSTVGRIKFDCTNCGVYTDWRPSCATSSSSSSSSSTGSSSSSTTTSQTTTTPPATRQEISEENSKPKQLFDIQLILENAIVRAAKDLVAKVTFTSFGTEPTPVELTFVIYDKDNREVYRTQGNLTVQTEAFFTREFKTLTLPSGKYKLVLTTLYNTDVRDEFSQSFEVNPNYKTRLNWQQFWWGGLVALPLIFILIRVRKTKSRTQGDIPVGKPKKFILRKL